MIPVDPFQFPTLVWKWPIAVYLFLVGVSVGSVTFAVLIKQRFGGRQANLNGIVRSAAILGPVAVSAGLILLIFDLVQPFRFWMLMLHYNWTSIMAIGVMLFQTYMAFLIIWLVGVFQDEVIWVRKWLLGDRLSFADGIIRFMVRLEKVIEPLLLLNAAALGAYTGFLLAALKSYPMLNSPVLPVLFLISGLSSGVAAVTLMAITVFRENPHHQTIGFLHRFELPLVFAEIFLLFCFFTGLYYGGGQKTAALGPALFAGGFWANVFWYGVLGIGILSPLAIRFLHPSGQHNKAQMLLTCVLSLCGILMLRYYILYAGQLTIV